MKTRVLVMEEEIVVWNFYFGFAFGGNFFCRKKVAPTQLICDRLFSHMDFQAAN